MLYKDPDGFMNNKPLLPIDIYNQHLKKISGVPFTYREVDVISALLNMEGNQIPSFLVIQPRGIEAHTRNIRQKAGGLTDQKSIIEFIKKSEKFSLLKNEYFLSLKIRVFFEKQLEKFSKGIGISRPVCHLLYEENTEYSSSLLLLLREHLKLTGIHVKSGTLGVKGQAFLDFIENNNTSEKGFLIYIAPKNLDRINQQAIQAIKNSNALLILPTKKKEIFSVLPCGPYICVDDKENYYDIFFEILKNIFPRTNLDNLISEFRLYGKTALEASRHLETQIHSKSGSSKIRISVERLFGKFDNFINFFKRHFIKFIITIGFLSLFIVLCIIFWSPHRINNVIQNTNIEKIQSDLFIPTQATFLNRDKLLADIQKKLVRQAGIQTVSLVGCGGAGKTTLARQYARQQTIPLIWEINAETKESLITSLEVLAYAASKTPEEKRELRELQEIKNPSEREGQLLIFLKNRLREQPYWLLIYDNVESLTDIQSYFPHDSKIWGNGHVIITTQNISIKKNSYVENMKVINVGTLNDSEKLHLFNKIIRSEENQGADSYKDSLQKTNFLKEIPPFPLDVSTAAYFLKDTHMPYEQYLKYLNEQFDYLEESQYSILRDVGKYNKTRYAIISLSLKQIIDAHTDFKDVLLLISLVDSQNIPKELVYLYKNNIFAEKFLHELKKRSFIIEENNINIPSTFSIHRSVQKIFLSCLIKKYSLQKDSASLHRIIDLIDKYVSEKIDQEDIKNIAPFVSHLEKILRHNNLISPFLQDSLKGELGFIYFYLSQYEESKELLIKSIKTLKESKKNPCKMGRLCACLASVYIAIGDIKKGVEYHIQSVDTFQKYLPDNHLKLAQHLTFLGNAYRDLGEYKKAKNTLEYANSIFKNKSLQHYFGYARNLVDLGKAYRSLGEYKKAKVVLEEGFAQYKHHFSKDHFRSAWAARYLAQVYNDLKMYEEAKNLLEYALLVYEKNFSVNYKGLALNLTYLGYTYKGLGQYKKAVQIFENALVLYNKAVPDDHIEVALALVGLASCNLKPIKREIDLIKKCLAIYQQCYGETNTEVAQILISLGETYDRHGDLRNAEAAFIRASEIFEKNKHPANYMALEGLAELYLKKSTYEEKKGDTRHSKVFKVQAIEFLKKSLEIIKIYFPEDSSYIKRIQNKVIKLKQG